METKHCPDCRQDLPLSSFTKNRRSRDGLAFYCGSCARARHVASRRKRLGPAKHRGPNRPSDIPEGMKWCPECDEVKDLDQFARNRAMRDGVGTYCRPCHNRITRANREAHGGARNYHLRRRYGITVDDFDRMFAEQDGVCAICREAPTAHVDHDHVTGRVRGLLCFNCNGALGQFRDRGDLMLKAVIYLRREPGAGFVAPPSDLVEFYLGPVDDPRPEGEPWPVEYDDEPRVA